MMALLYQINHLKHCYFNYFLLFRLIFLLNSNDKIMTFIRVISYYTKYINYFLWCQLYIYYTDYDRFSYYINNVNYSDTYWYLWFYWQSLQMTNLAQPIILILSIRSQFDVHGALDGDKVKQSGYTCLIYYIWCTSLLLLYQLYLLLLLFWLMQYLIFWSFLYYTVYNYYMYYFSGKCSPQDIGMARFGQTPGSFCSVQLFGAWSYQIQWCHQQIEFLFKLLAIIGYCCDAIIANNSD